MTTRRKKEDDDERHCPDSPRLVAPPLDLAVVWLVVDVPPHFPFEEQPSGGSLSNDSCIVSVVSKSLLFAVIVFQIDIVVVLFLGFVSKQTHPQFLAVQKCCQQTQQGVVVVLEPLGISKRCLIFSWVGSGT